MTEIRKQKRIKQIQEKKAKEMNQSPVNKDFLNKLNDKGEYVYPLAKKIYEWKFSNMDVILDDMRQIAAYYGNIKNMIKHKYDLKKELVSGEIKTRHTTQGKEGMLMDEIDLKNAILADEINIHRNITKLRDKLLNDFLGKIDGETLTGEGYNTYLEYVVHNLKKLGYDLMPETLKPILLE